MVPRRALAHSPHQLRFYPFTNMNEILSISALNRQVRQILEAGFPLQWVKGEVSNLTRASSGHIYFSLKDAQAQVRCVMFRSRAQILPWRLENGQQVEAQVLVSLYEPRGDFQLNVEGMRRAGLGQLFEEFSRRKTMLEQEGLFAPERKRALPRFPQTIGIVSSPKAAALADLLTALYRRAPHVPVILYPSPVQGAGAAAQIAAAIAMANTRRECEVLILARGGGSIEDLWSFNEEIVARAVAGSEIPTISGVGHETDITLADFAADVRAATPTAAAELASAGWFAARVQLDEASSRLQGQMHYQLQQRQQRTDLLAARLLSPRQRLSAARQQLQHQATRLQRAQQQALQRTEQKLQRIADALQHLNPDATLARGYSIVRDSAGKIVLRSQGLQPGESVKLQFAQGSADAEILQANAAPEA